MNSIWDLPIFCNNKYALCLNLLLTSKYVLKYLFISHVSTLMYTINILQTETNKLRAQVSAISLLFVGIPQALMFY